MTKHNGLEEGAGRAHDVDAGVRVERAVLGGDERLGNVRGESRDVDDLAVGDAEAPHLRGAVGVVNGRRLRLRKVVWRGHVEHRIANAEPKEPEHHQCATRDQHAEPGDLGDALPAGLLRLLALAAVAAFAVATSGWRLAAGATGTSAALRERGTARRRVPAWRAGLVERRTGWEALACAFAEVDVPAGRVETRCGAFGWSFTYTSPLGQIGWGTARDTALASVPLTREVPHLLPARRQRRAKRGFDLHSLAAHSTVSDVSTRYNSALQRTAVKGTREE